MTKVFLISGLGADRRLYNKIDLPEGYQRICADWILPDPQDTLGAYAQKLIDQLNITDGSIVVGVSLGGILAVEIAKKIDLEKVILISSIKKTDEEPWYFPIARKLPVHKLIPGQIMTRVGFMVRYVFGKMDREDLLLFRSMLSDSSPLFLKWAMNAVVHFDNRQGVDNLYHIVGDKDLMFPYKNIKTPDYTIKGGTHIMVFNRAGEINKILAEILQSR